MSEHTLAEFLIDFRHDLHEHPELSHQEVQTTEKIKAILQQHDIRVLDLPLTTGLVAEIGSGSPLIVLRSDIDALPIEEASGDHYASKHQGVMHACGHDFHASAVLGAAILLKQQEAALPGLVRLLFQAAEETGLGAPEFIDAGVLDGAAAIFGLHNDPSLPVGVIGSKAGALTAGVDRFEVIIQAKGSHAAKPHEGNDPIIILGQLISTLQSVISRNVPSQANSVLSITHVESGSTWNVIPDSAYVEGTVRSFDPAVRSLIESRFRTIVAGLATAFGAEIEVRWHAGPPSVINTESWVDFALDVVKSCGLEARYVEASPIGEDFAFYQEKIPGAFMMVGSGGPYALHHPKFHIDDRALYPTAHYLSELARQSLQSLRG